MTGVDFGKERGIFLPTMLVIFGLLWVGRLFTIVSPSHFSNIYPGGPGYSYLLNVLFFGADTLGLIAIIRWWRWGMYILAVSTLATIIFDLIYFPTQATWLDHLVTLVPIILLAWGVGRKWAYFK